MRFIGNSFMRTFANAAPGSGRPGTASPSSPFPALLPWFPVSQNV